MPKCAYFVVSGLRHRAYLTVCKEMNDNHTFSKAPCVTRDKCVKQVLHRTCVRAQIGEPLRTDRDVL